MHSKTVYGKNPFARHTDTEAIFAGDGLAGHLDLPTRAPDRPDYVGSTDPKDPILSPIYADLSGLPPSLFIAGGRDYLLSGTANLRPDAVRRRTTAPRQPVDRRRCRHVRHLHGGAGHDGGERAAAAHRGEPFRQHG